MGKAKPKPKGAAKKLLERRNPVLRRRQRQRRKLRLLLLLPRPTWSQFQPMWMQCLILRTQQLLVQLTQIQ
jgi:hypothetical protein